MSRITGLSAQTIKELFSTESSDTIVSALTISYSPYVDFSTSTVTEKLHIVDNFTHRIEYNSPTQYALVDLDTKVSTLYTFNALDSFVKDIMLQDIEELYYGMRIDGLLFLFIPFTLTLPTDEIGSLPVCKITLSDVTRYLTPVVRTISEPPVVDVSLAMKSSGEIVASLPEFLMSNITYSAETLTADLTIESFISEPFPAHSFTPAAFPGIF